jgi:RNA polymerase sigma-70 factor (ECF subfamily)
VDSEVSDESLISGICDGNKDALARLFRRYARLVRSVAYKVLRDPFEADDLLQEIFLLIHKNAAAFDSSKAPARFWILQMTYHRAISRRRYLSYRQFYTRVDLDDAQAELSDPRDENGKIEESIDWALGNSQVQKLMASLSENQQRTLKLYFFESYTLEEIAAALGQSRQNVKHHYFRGLDKLRKQLFRSQSD